MRVCVCVPWQKECINRTFNALQTILNIISNSKELAKYAMKIEIEKLVFFIYSFLVCFMMTYGLVYKR